MYALIKNRAEKFVFSNISKNNFSKIFEQQLFFSLYSEGKSKPHTPLHIAARDGHVDCMNFLLDCKANVNAINQGKTLFHFFKLGVSF